MKLLWISLILAPVSSLMSKKLLTDRKPALVRGVTHQRIGYESVLEATGAGDNGYLKGTRSHKKSPSDT
jgi:hypothetical protein